MSLQVEASSVVLYNPMNGEFGKAKFKNSGDLTEVYVQLAPDQSLIIETYQNEIEAAPYNYYSVSEVSIPLTGRWKITFTSGGPELPDTVETDTLASWTTFGSVGYPSFSGTATYTLSFAKPNQVAEHWLLDLGKVKESAEVVLNGKTMGTLIGPVYQLQIDHKMLLETNILEIKVSNLMANRIADLDRRQAFWRKFYNVNFPSRKTENRKNGLFDASHWLPKESGLLGPVSLTKISFN